MRAHYISRHNAAVCALQKALMFSPHAGTAQYMDATPANMLPAGVLGTRLPQWLLPQIDDPLRDKLRPDLLFITNFNNDPMLPSSPAHRRRHCQTWNYHVHIVELGFTSDTDCLSRLATKNTQHTQLQTLLSEAGWPQITTSTFIIGTAGGIPTTLETYLLGLSIPTATVTHTLNKINRMAVLKALDIYRSRRILEATSSTT